MLTFIVFYFTMNNLLYNLFLFTMYNPLVQKIQQAAVHLQQHGYAIIPNFISPETCQAAINEVNRLIDQFQPNPENMIVFGSTNGNSTHRYSKYFLESSDKVRCFFEPKALHEGQMLVPKRQAINKVGHALHEHNKIFGDITHSPGTWQICKQTGKLNPTVVQSMVVLKPPKIGNRVRIHQDSTHLYTKPDSLLGFWLPLQDATIKNGCLWGLPGSHNGKLYHRSKIVNGLPIDEVYHQVDYKQQDFIPMQMQKGSLAIFTGKFLHRSLTNQSQVSRYAYTWHLMDSSSEWCSQNWLQRPSFAKFVKKDFQ